MARQHNPEVSFLIKLAEYNEKNLLKLVDSIFSILLLRVPARPAAGLV